MMKRIFFACASLVCCALVQAKEVPDSLKQKQLDEVVVTAVRVGRRAPVAFSSLSEKQIQKENAGKSVPYLLQTLPSVVSFSEDGSGLGNTSYRIRGVDDSRINVTYNGMPLNNPESQSVYWVDFPDISNALQSLQVQRGVGTSSNGTASLGGSISLNTIGGRPKAYGGASVSLGSYNSFLYNLSGGTGILKNGLSVDARFSKVRGDGYIRNGKVDHHNIYAALSYYGAKDLFRFSYLRGVEHTGITWEGITKEQLEKNRRYNPAGEYTDESGNTRYYDDETDNYYSDIFQATFSRFLSNTLTLNTSLSYNHGYGYYQNFKEDKSLSAYGLPTQMVDGSAYGKSDAIQRKLLANGFYVANASLAYTKEKWNFTAGALASYYDGDHFGRVTWVKFNQNIPGDFEWYRNTGRKADYNLFGKAEYSPVARLSLFGEAQYRYIDYRIKGIDDDLQAIVGNYYYSFFNPKAGASFRLDAEDRLGEIYASLSVANREPVYDDVQNLRKKGRNDFVKPERLFDYELGYRLNRPSYAFSANFYLMDYKDQLVSTGKLSDVGYRLKENVAKSYRAGIELAGSYSPVKILRLDANLTLSRNKIKDYRVFYDVYDADGNVTSQKSDLLRSTDISLSPNVVGSGVVTFSPVRWAGISWIGKYVGPQFLDNTSDGNIRIDGYFFSNFTLSLNHKVKKLGEIELQVYVNNLFNKKYVANGYGGASYGEGSDVKQYYVGYFPQAERNFMTRLSLKF